MGIEYFKGLAQLAKMAEEEFEAMPSHLLCADCQTRGIPNTRKWNWPLCDSCIEKSTHWRPLPTSPSGEGTK